jgi:hypothetical protein
LHNSQQKAKTFFEVVLEETFCCWFCNMHAHHRSISVSTDLVPTLTTQQQDTGSCYWLCGYYKSEKELITLATLPAAPLQQDDSFSVYNSLLTLLPGGIYLIGSIILSKAKTNDATGRHRERLLSLFQTQHKEKPTLKFTPFCVFGVLQLESNELNFIDCQVPHCSVMLC